MAVMEREQRPAWTDERLDDLNKKVDDGFGELRAEIRAQRKEIREEIALLRQQTHGDNALVHKELGDIHRAIHQTTFALVGSVFVGFCGMIAAFVSLV
jgi:ribosome recycling factor